MRTAEREWADALAAKALTEPTRNLVNEQLFKQGLCHLGESLVGLGRLDGASEAYRQALSLFDALGNALTATEARAGRRLLLRYADCIDDESLRRSFLERVPVHRELWEAENPNRA